MVISYVKGASAASYQLVNTDILAAVTCGYICVAKGCPGSNMEVACGVVLLQKTDPELMIV